MKEGKVKQKPKLYRHHPVIFWGCIVIEAVALIVNVVNGITETASVGSIFGDDILVMLIASHLLVIPAVLTYINIGLIFTKPKPGRKWKMKVRCFEILSTLVGFVLSAIALGILANARYADWNTQIAIFENHSPIWLRSIPTITVLVLIGIVGYFILAFTHAKKTPPLVTVLAISALYIGVFECVIWSIQVYKVTVLLIILPINLIIIAARLIREKALELKMEGEKAQGELGGFCGFINKELASGRFPIWALVLVFPLLGVAIGILVLFGQRPDDIIKGYTETADWTFSQQIGATTDYDGHYLCTVAAQGHKRLVKPQRVGIRHGRKILVNRQLCIANAFEQILEEHTPKLHMAVRNFYDTHGFPLSKLIKTKVAADFIYVVMKPAEWLFLVTLYLFTVNPEERISRQYRK